MRKAGSITFLCYVCGGSQAASSRPLIKNSKDSIIQPPKGSSVLPRPPPCRMTIFVPHEKG